jgi:hypothetical protein
MLRIVGQMTVAGLMPTAACLQLLMQKTTSAPDYKRKRTSSNLWRLNPSLFGSLAIPEGCMALRRWIAPVLLLSESQIKLLLTIEKVYC